ncbi:hypothetical protein M378DRAFT_68924 [Amanita muscaria Koide BX008]|uniref:JmjC domain-containing protein n=1 Tax=Amanita muscaria (strain Koide BX008) TaxID=946122 RepID=A0A0C2XJK3_AMAMK|nr:hypothetical protein M378DRAFT_68924 [Amanita muscaria Koide BX008]
MASASSPAALYQWRCLHTDSSIIRSIMSLNKAAPLEAVSSLDTAIIISGATGINRLQLVQDLIQEIQNRYIPRPQFSGQFNYPIRGAIPVVQPESAALSISRLDSPPSLLTFQSRYYQEPFIVPGYAKDWPAMQEHPWRSAAYLRSISGAGRVVPVEIGEDYRSDDWSQKLVSWDDFLSTLDFVDQPCSNGTKTMYLAQHNIFMQFPVLHADIMVPDYVYADLSNSNHVAPENDEGLVTNAWLGPRGTISPAHTDPYYNMYVQLVGCKTVWLAPPDISSWMYPCTQLAPPEPDSKPEMSNTTRVDVFGKRTINENQFPDFWKEVVPRAMSYTLSAGDLLYIPAGWWHSMRSEETSISVSMWF